MDTNVRSEQVDNLPVASRQNPQHMVVAFLAGAAATVLAVEVYKDHKKARKITKDERKGAKKVKNVLGYHSQSKKSNCVVFGMVNRCTHRTAVGAQQLRAIVADCKVLLVGLVG